VREEALGDAHVHAHPERLVTPLGTADRLGERAIARKIPLAVHVDLTMRCNELCVHCYRTVEEDRPELTTAEVTRVLEEMAAAGALYLTFSGGEIFLRRDLFELIAVAKRLRFDVHLKTNALLVTEERARRLRELGVRQIDVSVYSADPAVHDAITKVSGSLARSLAGVERLRAAGLQVKLNCPMMSVNAAGYREVRALAERVGAMCGFDPMITPRNDGDRAPTLLRIGRADLRRILADPTIKSPARRSPDAPAPEPHEVPCGAAHSSCYVSAYGDVMPCVAMPVVCGNVRETPFGEIWASAPRMLDVRSIRRRDLSLCASCEAAPFCQRCPGQALTEDGDLRGPSLAACEQAVAAAEVAGIKVVPATWRARSQHPTPA
jgi:radical SAM protein with 4Fe4S-binding SPASM domain